MRTIERSSQFKADYKRERKGSYRTSIEPDLKRVMEFPVSDAPVPTHYCDHALTGAMQGYRDLHVRPDLLLIYSRPVDKGRGNRDLRILRLVRLGSHSELGF